MTVGNLLRGTVVKEVPEESSLTMSCQTFTNINTKEINKTIKEGRKEDKKFKDDIKKQGAYAIRYVNKYNKKAIVLAGRPYHLDQEINHGIDKLITTFDIAVLTEDSVSHFVKMQRPIRVLDQWMYHSRLYKAAILAGRNSNIEIVQLTSFGCGLDAVTTDQVEEIMSKNNNLYTALKIDEGSNLGAAKIRIRSLKAALEEREKNNIKYIDNELPFIRKIFSKKMKKDILFYCLSYLQFIFNFCRLPYQTVVIRLLCCLQLTKML